MTRAFLGEHVFSVHSTEREKSNELIQQNKSWKEAQHYCRQRHTDLASGFHQKNREKFNLKPNVYYWIGLFRDTWRWSDGSNSSFRGRHLEQFQDEANRKCAKLDEHGKLDSDSCDKRIPFICYEGEIYTGVSYRRSTGVSQNIQLN